jgi:hypothetical protein
MKAGSQTFGASLALCLLVASSMLIGAEKPLVYVAPLPSGAHAAAAAGLARELRSALERRGVQNLAGPTGPNAAGLEEITSASNAAGAQVSVGIRLVPSRTSCATVRTPKATPFPAAELPTETRLAPVVKQIMLAERSRDSELLAQELKSLGQPCPALGDWTSDYFLREASGASVVLEVEVTHAQSFAEPAAEAIVRFVIERGRRTRG